MVDSDCFVGLLFCLRCGLVCLGFSLVIHIKFVLVLSLCGLSAL